MAPEMMKGNKYDEKVDIFSFGIILCEVSLLTYLYSFISVPGNFLKKEAMANFYTMFSWHYSNTWDAPGHFSMLLLVTFCDMSDSLYGKEK